MKGIADYKILLWDFDGVIMDSMPVRDRGFAEVLKEYPSEQVEQLMYYHRQNGGLSRYVKFRYFFNKVRNEEISDLSVEELAKRFSEVMLSNLLDEKLFIENSLSFIRNNQERYIMHIVSGSDGNELNQICKTLHISDYFKSIQGSPTPKIELVRNILQQYQYDRADVALIGDSKNDYDASQANGIDFWGFNNPALLNLTKNYIHSFS